MIARARNIESTNPWKKTKFALPVLEAVQRDIMRGLRTSDPSTHRHSSGRYRMPDGGTTASSCSCSGGVSLRPSVLLIAWVDAVCVDGGPSATARDCVCPESTLSL